MVNESLYNRTVEILVQAYFNDTLKHGCPCGCAVGNLVLAHCGKTVKRTNAPSPNGHPMSYNPDWYFSVLNKNNSAKGYPVNVEHGNYQIAATGYTLSEIDLIEKAFEGVGPSGTGDDDKDGFLGLMAVIDVLDEIHENKDTVITQASKVKFNRSVPCT